MPAPNKLKQTICIQPESMRLMEKQENRTRMRRETI